MKAAGTAALFATAALLSLFAGCGDDSPTDTDDNRNPVIDTLIVDPSTAVEGDTVDVSVIASDPDGDTLTYVYQPEGGFIVGDGEEVRWVAPNGTGTYSLLASVTDGRTGVDSETADLVVTEAPQGISGTASINPGADDLVGARLALYLTLSDWENNQPLYDETVPEDSPNSYSFAITPMPEGVYYLDIWKDLNGDEVRDESDLVGFYGSGTLADPELIPILVEPNEVTILVGIIDVS